MDHRMHEETPAVHTSLGLQALCQRLQEVSQCDILDLGPVRNSNIEFWSRFGPSIYIADLRSSLPLPAVQSEDAEFVPPDWDTLLELPREHTFNVVLAWDLLNYMDVPVVSSLIEYLKRFCRRGAMFFALIFDQKQMPGKITVYQITDESHLKYDSAGSETCPCPRHQPRTVTAVMSQFVPADSFRLKNGVVEYLFEFEG